MDGPTDEPRPYGERVPWSRSDRLVPRVVVQPMQRFMAEEAAGGAVMLVAAVVALVWANSGWWSSYERLLETPIVLEIGSVVALDELSLKDWINEGLMTLFFFLMAMEVKREVVFGELRDPRKASVPVIAAVGGMVVPALVYLGFNAGTDAVDGWGIPMATDIAFAVAVVSLLGNRLPPAAKVFILTLAVVDDIGAIVVIALVYTSQLDVGWLAVAAGGVLCFVGIRMLDLRSMYVVVVVGLGVWFAVLQSGIEATLAGVMVGFLVPARPFYRPDAYARTVRPMVDRIQATMDDGVMVTGEAAENERTFSELIHVTRESVSPLQRLSHALEPWVAFVIVPVFALFNAGVRFVGDGSEWEVPVILGVGVGLVLGKLVGVFGATWIAVRLGVGRLPTGTSWAQVLGLATTAGIGFTVALFVTELAFDAPTLADSAKIGILGASLLAGIVGFTILLVAGRSRTPPAGAVPQDEATVPARDRDSVAPPVRT